METLDFPFLRSVCLSDSYCTAIHNAAAGLEAFTYRLSFAVVHTVGTFTDSSSSLSFVNTVNSITSGEVNQLNNSTLLYLMKELSVCLGNEEYVVEGGVGYCHCRHGKVCSVADNSTLNFTVIMIIGLAAIGLVVLGFMSNLQRIHWMEKETNLKEPTSPSSAEGGGGVDHWYC